MNDPNLLGDGTWFVAPLSHSPGVQGFCVDRGNVELLSTSVWWGTSIGSVPLRECRSRGREAEGDDFRVKPSENGRSSI